MPRPHTAIFSMTDTFLHSSGNKSKGGGSCDFPVTVACLSSHSVPQPPGCSLEALAWHGETWHCCWRASPPHCRAVQYSPDGTHMNEPHRTNSDTIRMPTQDNDADPKQFCSHSERSDLVQMNASSIDYKYSVISMRT